MSALRRGLAAMERDSRDDVCHVHDALFRSIYRTMTFHRDPSAHPPPSSLSPWTSTPSLVVHTTTS
jgi:hypothetical protein